MKTDPAQLDVDDSEIVAQGQLSVTCCELSRLAVGADVTGIYYTIAVGKVLECFLSEFRRHFSIQRSFPINLIRHTPYPKRFAFVFPGKKQKTKEQRP